MKIRKKGSSDPSVVLFRMHLYSLYECSEDTEVWIKQYGAFSCLGFYADIWDRKVGRNLL